MSSFIKPRLPFIIIIAILSMLVIYINWPSVDSSVAHQQRIVPVKVSKVLQTEFVDSVETMGTTKAKEQVLITSLHADFVSGIHFVDGQKVRKNDVLITLQNEEEKAKVKELEANLAESVAQLNRYQGLFKTKATSQSQVDEEEAQTKAIAAQLLIARTKLDELTIRAPFDGVLGFKQISKGAYIKAGDVITSLDDMTVIKADFFIPERLLTTIKIGQAIKAKTSAYQDIEFSGVIKSIDSRVDEITRSVKVRSEIPNADLKLLPGMLVTVIVERQIDTILQVPESAIIPIEDKHYVFVVEENTAKRVLVQTGRRKAGIVEILGGIIEGQPVVVEGALKLQDGSQVNVLEQVL